MLTLQPVVVVESLGVDAGDVALAVLGDDFLGAGLDLLGEFGKRGARQGEREITSLTENRMSGSLLALERGAGGACALRHSRPPLLRVQPRIGRMLSRISRTVSLCFAAAPSLTIVNSISRCCADTSMMPTPSWTG